MGVSSCLLNGIWVATVLCEIFCYFSYVELVVAYTMWNLCRFSWLPQLRKTFVGSVGYLRYMGPLLLQLVASAT